MAIDRESIVKNVSRGGQIPANYFTPPSTAGYTTRARIPSDIEAAKALLAEAGYPNGEGFPKASIIFNTSENHRSIAAAIQEMWRKHLNIEVELNNQEWKVYLMPSATFNTTSVVPGGSVITWTPTASWTCGLPGASKSNRMELSRV